MATKNQKNKLLYLGFIAVAIAIAFFVFKITNKTDLSLFNRNDSQSSDKSTNQIYTSKTLRISVGVSKEFQIEDKLIDVIFKKGNEEIILSRIGTNFTTIEEYLDNLENKNKTKINDKETLNYNSYKIISGYINRRDGNNEKVYFIYPDQWVVYTISTTYPNLYDYLDKIARSFRYAP